jgi:hypothetical protein
MSGSDKKYLDEKELLKSYEFWARRENEAKIKKLAFKAEISRRINGGKQS